MTAFSTSIASDRAGAPARERAAGCRAGGDCFEGQLVAEAQSGSQEAFRVLVERYQDAVFAFCCQWLGCVEDAREVCQDTFVRAYGALPRYRPRAKFSTWLYRIALNLCRDAARSPARRQRRSRAALSEDLPCRQAAPDEALMREADTRRLHEAIAGLSPRLREVVVLHCIEGLSHVDCGAVLGCSPRAVEGRLYRARRELLSRLDGNS